MHRSRFNGCGSAVRLGAFAFVAWAGAAGASFEARPLPTTPQKWPASLLEQAIEAERELHFDIAADRLYRVLLDRPHTPEATVARMVLGRLLALSGDPATALLQYQSLRDGLPADDPLRKTELDLATTLARRLRAAANTGLYRGPNLVPLNGVGMLDDPTSVSIHASGAILLVDSGKGLAYRVEGDTATVVPGMQNVTAAAFLPDSSVVVAGRSGLSVAGGKPTTPAATWDRTGRQLRRVRALAATADGGLLVVDRDYDGVLRCRPTEATCTPWGPAGRVRTVKVGTAGFVYLLDDNQPSVRVVDQTGRLIVTIGPTVGTTKSGDIVDIAVDALYGVYLLDKQLRRVQIVALRSGAGNEVTAELLGSISLPMGDDRAARNPTAIGVAPNGALLVAGRSVIRFE